MKILKATLLLVILTFAACNTDQSVIDHSHEDSKNVLKQKSNTEYSLEEVLNGIRKWDSLRSDSDAILPYFESYNALNLDISQFPQGNALHAYACILDGKLKFAVISETYDNDTYHDSLMSHIKIVDLYYTDIATLSEQTYESFTFPLPTQYIEAADAINRVEDWNSNYTGWLNTNISIYYGFNIPTYSLTAQSYTVYFGLKNDIENPIIKEADLIFNNNLGAFFDAVHSFPRGKTDQYYLIDLI